MTSFEVGDTLMVGNQDQQLNVLENHSCQDNVPCLVCVDAHSCGPWLDSLALEVNTIAYPVSLLLLGQFFPRPNY